PGPKRISGVAIKAVKTEVVVIMVVSAMIPTAIVVVPAIATVSAVRRVVRHAMGHLTRTKLAWTRRGRGRRCQPAARVRHAVRNRLRRKVDSPGHGVNSA